MEFLEMIYVGKKAYKVERVEYKGKKGVDIREMYEKGGEFLPTRSGIRLYDEQEGELDGITMQAFEALMVSLFDIRDELKREGVIE